MWWTGQDLVRGRVNYFGDSLAAAERGDLTVVEPDVFAIELVWLGALALADCRSETENRGS